MLNFIFRFFSKYFFLLSLRLSIKKNYNENFKDLNFKQNDFINYKVVKHNTLKENFILINSSTENHTFNFLQYYQVLGGKKGIELSKKNIFLWFKKYKYYKSFPWANDYASRRFINIIYSYDYICSISKEKEIKFINFILNFHIKRILFQINRKKNENLSSYDVLAETLIDCIKKRFTQKNIKKILEFIDSHVDESSMHKSYNILEHSKFINNLNEIKNILLFYKFEVPETLTNKILAMTSLLSIYRHQDFTLPLFNGCNNNHNTQIHNILNKEQFLSRKPLTFFKNGIAAYKDSNKALFFDVVQPSIYAFHNELSAGSLAFEISAEGEKIITNCGGTELQGKNPEYLKYSAAHSTIIINNTNISEIKDRKTKKIFPKQVIFEKSEENNKIILSGKHNGYINNYKKICKREIIIDTKNNIFKGEDTIISIKSPIEKNVYHIRFHLMPAISTTITENKKNIIIRTKNNKFWIFKSNNEIVLENSIYVHNDMAIESSQIVISGITSNFKNIVKWSLEKI